MTRLNAALYLLCLFLAAQPGPHAYTCAVCAPLVGFLVFAAALQHLFKGDPHHD